MKADTYLISRVVVRRRTKSAIVGPLPISTSDYYVHVVKESKILQIAILVVALTLVLECRADEQQCPPIKTVVSPDLYFRYEGETEPDKIPDHLKYRRFVGVYNIYLDELVQHLSRQDHAILSNLKIDADTWRFADNEQYSRDFLNLCTSSSNMDAVAYAREYERIAAESNNRFAERVRRAFNSLSSDGRQLVENYIAEKITPKLSHPIKTAVDYALEDPEQTLFQRELMCYMQINGEPPPKLARMIECSRRQFEAETDNDKFDRPEADGQIQGGFSLDPDPEN